MGLTTPLLLDITAFDSNESKVIKFDVKGGVQISSNRLKIINNKTGEIVYNEVQPTYLFKHELKPNTLQNNQYYSAQLQTLDVQNNESQWSNMVQFYCYTNPSLKINNLLPNTVVNGSSYSFEGLYNQIEGELLDSYKFDLYDIFGNQISTSGLININKKHELPLTFNYMFYGLENYEDYQISLTAKTVEGTILKTDKIQFSVKYIYPSLYSLIYLENNCNGGFIDIESNITNINGTYSNGSPTYISNSKINLKSKDSYVLWDKGYRIDDDFNLRIWGSEFNDNSVIAIINNASNNNTIKISFRRDKNSDKVYVDMIVYNDYKEASFYCCSNKISLIHTYDLLFVCVRRINNQYEIKISNENEVV